MTDEIPTIAGNIYPGAKTPGSRNVPADGGTVNSNLDHTYTELAPLPPRQQEGLETGLNPQQFVFAEEEPPPPEIEEDATSSVSKKRSKKK